MHANAKIPCEWCHVGIIYVQRKIPTWPILADECNSLTYTSLDVYLGCILDRQTANTLFESENE